MRCRCGLASASRSSRRSGRGRSGEHAPGEQRRRGFRRLRGRSGETGSRRVDAINTFSRWLEDQDLIALDPCRKVRRRKQGGKEWRVLRHGNAMRLLVAMTAPSPEQLTDYVIVTLCPDSGLRRGEVIGANLADLD